MTKTTKLFILTIASAWVIIYIAVLGWNLLMVTTPYCDNDFKTFTLSLLKHQQPYKINRYVRVIHIEKHKNKTTLQTSPPITTINMNTPLMSVLLKAMLNISSKLSVTTFLYVLFSLCFAAISILFLLRYFSLNGYYLSPVLLLLWLSWPALYNLKVGQISFFLMPLLMWSFYLGTQKSYRVMAVTLGCLASLKLFFSIFLLFFILRRDWKSSGLFLFSFIIFFFSPLIYFHWSDFHAFFEMAKMRPLFLDRATLPMNGSLLGLVINTADYLHIIPSQNQITISVSILCLYAIIRYWIYDHHFLRQLTALHVSSQKPKATSSRGAVRGIQNLAIFTRFSGFRGLRRGMTAAVLPRIFEKSPFQDELRFSFLILLALLCSPLAWVYYFLFLIIPLAVIIKISQRYVLSIWCYIFLIDALILLYFPYTGKMFGLLGFLVHFSVFLSLLCWLFALNLAAQSVVANNIVTHKPQQQSAWILGIFAVYALLSVTALSFNYGMPYFLDPDKSGYLKTTAPVLWLPVK